MQNEDIIIGSTSNKNRLRQQKIEAAAQKFAQEREEAIAFNQREAILDTDSIMGRSVKENAVKRSSEKLARLHEEKYAECVARSLGHIVALATDIESDDCTIRTQIAQSTANVFKSLIAKGKINPTANFETEAPHLALYLNTLRNIAEYQVDLASLNRTEDQEYLDSNIKIAESYEHRLADVIRAKDRIVLNEERKLQEKYETDMAYANENAKFPEVYKSKKQKEYNSYFRKIMDAHVEGHLRTANEGAAPDKKRIATEAMITYNILELLHTSKLAPKAELDFVL